MTGNLSLRTGKVTILGDYPPRRCGIATFTRDIRKAVTAAAPEIHCSVVAVTDPGQTYAYPNEVRFEIAEGDIQAYLRAADFLNLSHVDVLCVQHEFGIYGGAEGGHVIALLRRAHMPTVTTLHTILGNPNPYQRQVFKQLVECSTKLVTMTNRGASMLRDIYGVPAEKIAIIPHGIPDIPFVDPNFYKDEFSIAGCPVLLTFGLLSPGKGIEYAIRALPGIVKRHPNVVYIILGATHPNLIREQGETYRLSLERLAHDLGVENNVMFINRYVDNRELYEFIGATDIYLTPYLNEAQVTSGTLAYCFGAGKAVVSTPYWHAAELLADGRGKLVPFRDSGAITEAVNALLDNDASLQAMRKRAYLLGREMVWPQVGHAYVKVFEEAQRIFLGSSRANRRERVATLNRARAQLPVWRFDHLRRMTDSTGTFQHAIYSLPCYEHGYCTDDNARTLLLTALLEEMEETNTELDRVQSASAAFLQHAYVTESGRFRNFMAFERQWLEECGSEDSHGRALWALGTVINRTRKPQLRAWATALFNQALKAIKSFTSPRAWAFAILGIQEYLEQLGGDLLANRVRSELAERILHLFETNQSPGWPWAEDIVTYDNARLPEALILAGGSSSQPAMVKTGLQSLRWLMEHQINDHGNFRPIGSNGFWKRGEAPARFDQQPIEAAASMSACIEAFNATGDEWWKERAHSAFDWFLGANDLGLSLYDPTTGGCFDGLHESRVNRNQGAESTLAFLISLAKMKAFQENAASFGPDSQSTSIP